jgi:MFS family permease
MRGDVGRLLERWTGAGVIDDETAARIRDFEGRHAGSQGMRWPVLIALAFGGIMIAGGVLLFVAAHWDALSPAARFALVLVLVAAFHAAGAVAADRFPAMSATLHGIGTAALGAGIFLGGQIFNLDEHWPGGVMLWALGAVAAWAVLGQLPQLALAAVLAPAWLASEWIEATTIFRSRPAERVLATFVVLLSLAYFTAPQPGREDRRRRLLLWVGGLALVPALIFLAVAFPGERRMPSDLVATPVELLAAGWAVAAGLPLLVAAALRGRDAWPIAAAAGWAAAGFAVSAGGASVPMYAWWALGAIGLVAWGVQESRRERINMGAAVFAATVFGFYFSEVMDKLERSASLVGLGVLFLAGGWALERVRRRLVIEAGRRA